MSKLPDDSVVWQFPHSVALLGPWQFYTGYCVLVARSHTRELHHLSEDVRRAYVEELCQLSSAVEGCFTPRKLNVESLGNQVPHLHWHIFPRYENDINMLTATWLAIDAAERDEKLKAKLQTGAMPLREITHKLRERLRHHGANVAPT